MWSLSPLSSCKGVFLYGNRHNYIKYPLWVFDIINTGFQKGMYSPLAGGRGDSLQCREMSACRQRGAGLQWRPLAKREAPTEPTGETTGDRWEQNPP